ncbi:MAG: helix-hairpin-helix domain-containing protein [Actinomycetota bacterium]|nr:helix-hairpin-helix domain-containing protein [Actinomycetota bacterium]
MPTANQRIGAIVVALALAIAVGAGAWYGSRGGAPVVEEIVGGVSYTTVAATIIVHVSGSVHRPGLVTVSSSARIADVIAAAGGATPGADLGGLNLAATVRDGDQVVVPVPGEAPSVSGGSNQGIDLNRSSADELEGLPGVGPVLAARIVEFRESNGPFSAVEDLLDVGGIGEAKLATMRDAIAAP